MYQIERFLSYEETGCDRWLTRQYFYPENNAMNPFKNTGLLFLLAVSITACSTKPLHGPRPSDWAVKQSHTPFHNFYKLNERIYRSEKPSPKDFQYVQQAGIQSVLDLRLQHKDVQAANGLALHLYHVPMKSKYISDQMIIDAMKIIKDAPKPLLIHCAHGSDRTGVVIAMYRILFQGWTKNAAIQEMQQGGYHFHWIHKNLVRYIQSTDIKQLKESIGIQ